MIAEIFAHDSDLLDENDVEDIGEVLAEISDNPIPKSEKQQKKWKRWLGKAAKTGKKFVGGRLEKAGDSTISEGIKDWVKDGGLDTITEFVTQL